MTCETTYNIEESIQALQNKLNEVIAITNTIIDSQKDINDRSEVIENTVKSWENSQLTYLDGIVLRSPNLTLYKIKVNDDGTLITEKR